MNTQIVENDFARIVMNTLYRLSLKFQDVVERRAERRVRRVAERHLSQMDPRLLRDIGYDPVNRAFSYHAQH